ncbi:type I secretion system permease/ATPase [Bradyrhizobium sp. CCGB01]|uniref:type I secretion system permease/ATPase n=1 Tax=Bradyrhizobium sp. CCGB01 TaxID=2949634 RepID=UPI0020B293BA|nr:type I secretion system permease/ATPase [Bradyrhizobium sp. CCGB01]MCP3407191.1 type I secretion system permease/ATPase [Bradyrhizobium sp. CCGB01]
MHMLASAKQSALADAFRRIRPGLLAAGGLSIFINLLVFVSPLYTMQIYDRVLTSRNGMTLLLLSVIALVLFISYAALEHFRSRVLVQTSLHFDRIISGDTFETALGQALSTSSSHHVQLLRDVDTLREVLSGGVITSLMDVPWTPIFLAICFLLHPLIGLVALIGAVIILTLAFLNERLTKTPLNAAASKNLHALDRLTSSLRNAEAIRALGMGPAVRAAWAETHGQALLQSATAGERGGTLLAISKFLRMAIQVSIMGVGAYLAIQQEISGGVLFAASLIMGRALAPVEASVSQWKALVAARTSYARLNRALEARSTVGRPTRLPALVGQVSLEAATVLVPGSQLPAIADVSFRLAPGEVVAVVGQSGSGKSSLARALVGAWPLVHGCVRIDGNDVRHFDPNFLGQNLGYLPQDVELFAGTVRDNIARFRDDASDEAVVEAAQLASAHMMIQRLPKGYDTVIGDNGAGLSGGQRQRIGLARALFGKPVLVVLDEPNANLDGDGDRALADAIQRLRQNKVTIVIINHRPNLLAAVDKIVFMHEGRLGRIGTREEMLPTLLGKTVAPMRRDAREPAEHHRADRHHHADGSHRGDGAHRHAQLSNQVRQAHATRQ